MLSTAFHRNFYHFVSKKRTNFMIKVSKMGWKITNVDLKIGQDFKNEIHTPTKTFEYVLVFVERMIFDVDVLDFTKC